MEVYENHLGGIYFSNEIIDDEYLYCDQCGDCDYHLGYADTWEEVMELITDEDGWCRYHSDYLKEAKEQFEKMRLTNESKSNRTTVIVGRKGASGI